MVCIQGDKIDKYGRTVGVIMFKGLDINLELVATGYAWHYKKYQNEQSKLAFLLNLLQLPKIKSAY